MFENPGSKKQHKKIKTVSAATENTGILLIKNYWGKLSIFYHRSCTQKEENLDGVTLLKGRVTERRWLVSKTRLREGQAPPPASGAGAEGGRVTLLPLGHQKKNVVLTRFCTVKTTDIDFCASCDTWISATTVCHGSQGVFTQQWGSAAARSVGEASIHHLYFALA